MICISRWVSTPANIDKRVCSSHFVSPLAWPPLDPSLFSLFPGPFAPLSPDFSSLRRFVSSFLQRAAQQAADPGLWLSTFKKNILLRIMETTEFDVSDKRNARARVDTCRTSCGSLIQPFAIILHTSLRNRANRHDNLPPVLPRPEFAGSLITKVVHAARQTLPRRIVSSNEKRVASFLERGILFIHVFYTTHGATTELSELFNSKLLFGIFKRQPCRIHATSNVLRFFWKYEKILSTRKLFGIVQQ